MTDNDLTIFNEAMQRIQRELQSPPAPVFTCTVLSGPISITDEELISSAPTGYELYMSQSGDQHLLNAKKNS